MVAACERVVEEETKEEKSLGYLERTLIVEEQTRTYLGVDRAAQLSEYLQSHRFEAARTLLDTHWESSVRDLCPDNALEGWEPDKKTGENPW